MQSLQNYQKMSFLASFQLTRLILKGPNFALYSKYQLLRYKPWQYNQNNAWVNQEPSDDAFIGHWEELVLTPYAEVNVPYRFDKLQTVIQSREDLDTQPDQQDSTSHEEWMIISDLHTPFQNYEHTQSTHDWHEDRTRDTAQQIGEMPTWTKTKREQATTTTLQECNTVNIDSFSEMQQLAYDLIKSHSEDLSADKEPLHLIITGVASTGKSYLINAIRNLLQSRCVVTPTTGKALIILEELQYTPC